MFIYVAGAEQVVSGHLEQASITAGRDGPNLWREAGAAGDGGGVSSVTFVYVAGGSPDVADARGRYPATRS
ncbi:hypothetical protein [Amycolatopsis sp. Hca4]|uniref:hypothetical protein n=1 Tax=Amycolatopsis sp. Hca4 TaxID=2742131 RepID=UPI0015913D5A|nr:hypothetical protein [Amycolatopsis sp. Hca4]QKV74129.1 hypothetical protein HUT10_10385 [Amycolatopsis sp. Hca4]